jgi:hypothetical protein
MKENEYNYMCWTLDTFVIWIISATDVRYIHSAFDNVMGNTYLSFFYLVYQLLNHHSIMHAFYFTRMTFKSNFVLMTFQLWLALCVATNRSTWFCTTVLVTNMRNFPLSRGTISGILKGSASKLLLFHWTI